jgi:tripartite-type tricarboxylate transporter receptor subunit TctC
MHLTRRALGPLLLTPFLAQAQPAWPSRPVRVIVPWAPGGGVDIVARLMSTRLSEVLGQPFTVDNRTGGGGIVGFQEAARAAPDGATLLALDNSYTMLPHTTASLPWDVAHAFRPVALAASGPFMLVVKADSRFRTLRDLVDAAKQGNEAVSFGTGGSGSSPHFMTEAFQQAAGVKMLHVPFRGGAQAMLAVVAGQVDCSMATISAAGSSIAAGQLRALAIGAEARSPLMPNVPTFAEAGLPGVVGGIWAGFAFPAGTPDAILAKLEGAVQAILREEGTLRRLAEQGLEPGGQGREDFATLIAQDTRRWGRVAEAAHFERQ